ncbi:MAG: hypothetical protein N2Z84_04080 [Atribacterota bacterium]|nr:hypothetical protein [Atribacterota bacterium]
MKKLLPILFLLLLFLISCQREIPSPPQPVPKLIPIPKTVDTVEEVAEWLRNSGLDYLSDKETTGYEDYRFTPAELYLSEIPDVASKTPRTIKKIPRRGDCDDYAILTAYLMEYVGLEAHYVELYTINAGHAISYGVDQKGRVHIFDLWFYQGCDQYKDIDEYIARRYPKWWKWKDMRILNYLNILFLRGHIQFHPEVLVPPSPKSTSPARKEKLKNYCDTGTICE